MTEELEDDIADLELILGLGKKQAEDIVQSIQTKAYRCAFSSDAWHTNMGQGNVWLQVLHAFERPFSG